MKGLNWLYVSFIEFCLYLFQIMRKVANKVRHWFSNEDCMNNSSPNHMPITVNGDHGHSGFGGFYSI
jgi:hypothetical protein